MATETGKWHIIIESSLGKITGNLCWHVVPVARQDAASAHTVAPAAYHIVVVKGKYENIVLYYLSSKQLFWITKCKKTNTQQESKSNLDLYNSSAVTHCIRADCNSTLSLTQEIKRKVQSSFACKNEQLFWLSKICFVYLKWSYFKW